MKYPFNVYCAKVDEHKFWIAECKLLKGCVGQGDTVQEALKELENNEKEWLATASEYGIPIPEIPIETVTDYSGKFTVRVSPFVHKTASDLAKQLGISLNQYVNDAIVSQNSAISTAEYIIPKVKDAVHKISMVMSASYNTATQQNYSTKFNAITSTTSLRYANKY